MAGIPPSRVCTRSTLLCRIQVTQHLDSIFPYLSGPKSIEVLSGDATWTVIRGTDQALPERQTS